MTFDISPYADDSKERQSGQKVTAEDYRDKIKPQGPPEFNEGDLITPAALASYVGLEDIDIRSDKWIRTPRIGGNPYTLEAHRWQVNPYSDIPVIDGMPEMIRMEYELHNRSCDGEYTEHGRTLYRSYVFIPWKLECGTWTLKCRRWSNVITFYDQMTRYGGWILVSA